MDEQALLSLLAPAGTVGGLAFIVWKAFQRHATKIEAFMEQHLRELTMLRAEVRTLVEVMSHGRVRTPPRGVVALRSFPRDTELDDGDSNG